MSRLMLRDSGGRPLGSKKISHKRHKKHIREPRRFPYVLFVPFVANLLLLLRGAARRRRAAAASTAAATGSTTTSASATTAPTAARESARRCAGTRRAVF